ncbi:MAG: hypothetical protein AAFU65_03360 [Pseudomonadota bacterium]
MNARSVLIAAVMLGTSISAAASERHRIDVLFDTSGSMQPARASLVSAVQTLAWSLVLAAEQETISEISLTLAGFCEDAEQIKVAGRDVFDTTQSERAPASHRERGADATVEAIAQGYTSEVLNPERWRGTSSGPMARPLASSLRVMIGEPVSFDGQAPLGSRQDLGILEWWRDIDGDNIKDYFGPNGSHVYLDTGAFPLTLHVVDSDGRRDRRTLWIDVYNP